MKISTKRMMRSDAIGISILIISGERNILLERSIFFNEYTLRKKYILHECLYKRDVKTIH